MSARQTVETSPQFKRLLGLAWIVIVGMVSACIFLGTWWSTNGARPVPPTATSIAVAAATLAASPAATPTLPPNPTGAPGMPALTPSAQVSLTTSTPLPVANPSFGYGIIIDAQADTQMALDQTQQLGLSWVKVPIRWADIETEPGNPDWETLDAIFQATSARNLNVLVTVTAAPNWARSVTAAGFDGPPDNVEAYASFVSQLLQRYRGAIHAVEVWSEMNRGEEWYAAGGLSSASYMALLVPAAQAIHAVDPGVIVISGGLNPTGIDDGIMAIDDFRYMQELIGAGLLDVVDCVGVHHKGYNLPPDVTYTDYEDPTALYRQPFQNRHHSWSFFSTVRGYNDMIVTAARETPICVTEFGWPSIGGLRRTTAPEFVYDNSLDEQATYIVQAFQLMRDWDFVWMGFLSNLDYSADEAGGGTDENLTIYYRITTGGGAPRPAYDALRDMTK